MTKTQKRLRELRQRQSQERGRMAELSQLDRLDDEQRAELDAMEAGTADLERLLRAAETAVESEEAEQRQEAPDTEDGEAVELRAIRQRATFAGYLAAAFEGRGASGAEGDLNAALKIPLLGLAGGTQFPMDLLAPRMEARAETDTDTATMPRRWLDRLFAGTAADALGITMESVPTGIASYPVTSTGAAAAQRGREEAAADAAWTIGVSTLKPTRNAVRAIFTIEDAARIPGLESALIRDLRMALVEGIDRVVFTGDDGADENSADIVGLTTASITETTLSQTDKGQGGGNAGRIRQHARRYPCDAAFGSSHRRCCRRRAPMGKHRAECVGRDRFRIPDAGAIPPRLRPYVDDARLD